jgi:type I restriction enzyme S subunit
MNSGELNIKRVHEVEGRITKEGLKNSSTKIIPPKSVLIGLAGQGKTRGTVAMNMVELCTNQSIAAIMPNSSFNVDYLYYNLDNRYLELRSMSTGDGGRGGLNLHIIRSILIPFPPLPEQHAIAAALSDADGLIGALDALIAKKRDVKQAAMQQLLTGRTRLPGFEGEWEEKRLGEVASIRNQKVLPSNVDQDTLCLELEHIGQGDGRLLDFGIASDSTSTKYRFFNGDILFGRLRSYLRKFWHADRAGICTTEIWPLMADGSRINSGFLYAAVQSDRFVEAASISYGTHMPRADWGVMKNFEICLPPLPEQTAIATVLSDMDAEIAALERRRDKAKEIKQGMMQQLLTGKVRLVSPEEMGEHNNNMVQA